MMQFCYRRAFSKNKDNRVLVISNRCEKSRYQQERFLVATLCRNDKTQFCYRRVLQQQVKRSIAVGYAVGVAKGKTSQCRHSFVIDEFCSNRSQVARRTPSAARCSARPSFKRGRVLLPAAIRCSCCRATCKATA